MANDMMNRRNDIMDAMNDWFGFQENSLMKVKIKTLFKQMLPKMNKTM